MSENNANETSILQLVGFKLAEEEFGVNILKVQEINRMLAITEIPNSPEFVEGIINLRGRIIPIVDLRARLNLPQKEHDNQTRIIVVEVDGKTVGFIVDEVSEVLRISENITEPPPNMVVSGIDRNYINSVVKLENKLLILLNMNEILSFDEKEYLKEEGNLVV